MKKRKEPRVIHPVDATYRALVDLKPLERVRFHMRNGAIRFGCLDYRAEWIVIADDQGGPAQYRVASLTKKSMSLQPIGWSRL